MCLDRLDSWFKDVMPSFYGRFGIVEAAREDINRLSGLPAISYADVIQLGGAFAVETCGGPSIPLTLGRVDSTGPDIVSNLPGTARNSSLLQVSTAESSSSHVKIAVLVLQVGRIHFKSDATCLRLLHMLWKSCSTSIYRQMLTNAYNVYSFLSQAYFNASGYNTTDLVAMMGKQALERSNIH